MSDYTPAVTFATKDALATGDGSKLVLGSELDTEFAAIATALATKADGAATAVQVVTATVDPDSYTGYGTPPTGNLRYVSYNDGTYKYVVLTDDAGAEHTATSNSTQLGINLSSVPTILPASGGVWSDWFETMDLSENRKPSIAYITSDGSFTMYAFSSTFGLSAVDWSNSGTKGFGAGWMLSWRIPVLT